MARTRCPGWIRSLSLLCTLLPSLALTGDAPSSGAGAGEPVPRGRSLRLVSVHVTPEEHAAYDASIGKPAPTVVHPPTRRRPGPRPIGTTADVQPMPPPSPTRARTGSDAEAMPLLDSFVGMVDNGTFIPPDTHGAVGPDHLVSILNRGYAVFDRSGAIVQGPISHQAFWAALGTQAGEPAEFPFDPVVLYDQHDGRFVATAVSGDFSNTSWLLFAISDSSDPTAGWTLYAIDTTTVSPAGFADFPGLGLDPDRLVMTVNTFDFVTQFFIGADFFIVDKSTILGGGAATVTGFNDLFQGGGGFTWRPVHAFGPTTVSYLVNSGWTAGGTTQFIAFQEISGPAGAPVLTDLGWIQVADYGADGIEDAPQLSCPNPISTGSTRLLNGVLRNGKVWTAQAVDDTVADGVGQAQAAWYEMDPTQASLPGPYAPPLQEGRIADPDLWFYYPSIAVNADECVAIGFAGSGENDRPGGYYTSRQASDPAGSLEPVSLLKDGEAPYFKRFTDPRNRWGDYSATMVDPLNDRTFWTIQEYAMPESGAGCPAPNTGNWGTFWGKFACTAVPPCEADADCDDSDACNGIESCDVATGQCGAGTPPDCDDGDPCTIDSCDPGTGCLHDPGAADGLPCEDGDPCTGPDVCLTGACISGPAPDGDGDSVCDALDCAPQDENFQTPPPEVDPAVTVTHSLDAGITTLTWPAAPQSAHYNAYSSGSPLSATMTCLESDDGNGDGLLVAEDPNVPAAGGVIHYLVTAESPCGEGPTGEECSPPGPACTPGPARMDPAFCPTPP